MSLTETVAEGAVEKGQPFCSFRCTSDLSYSDYLIFGLHICLPELSLGANIEDIKPNIHEPLSWPPNTDIVWQGSKIAGTLKQHKLVRALLNEANTVEVPYTACFICSWAPAGELRTRVNRDLLLRAASSARINSVPLQQRLLAEPVDYADVLAAIVSQFNILCCSSCAFY